LNGEAQIVQRPQVAVVHGEVFQFDHRRHTPAN
jgi:hypothetical protein